MHVILNIGLKNHDFTKGIDHNDALRVMAKTCLKANSIAIHQGDEEDTLVVEAWYPLNDRAYYGSCHEIASALEQDCVAIWIPGASRGELIGPGAANWGAFDPDLFLLLDGSRLSHQAALAA